MALELLRSSAAVRRFFAAHAQSTVGTGLTLVAFPLVAHERHGSPSAVAFVLLAELLPLMVAGPWIGALADRLPRTPCAVGADLLRAAALIVAATTGSFALTVLCAALAGLGTAVFQPAVLSGLPALTGDDRADAAMSLFSSVTSAGQTAGMLLAALLVSAVGADGALAVDAATFVLSAGLIGTVALGAPVAGDAPPADADAVNDAKESLLAVPAFASVLVAGAAVALAAGMSNVAEPTFLSRTLHSGAAGFGVMMAVWGGGMALGSLIATRRRAEHGPYRPYVLGMGLVAAGFLGAAASPALLPALVAFTVNGVGNGIVVVSERFLVRDLAGEGREGRAFGALESVTAWAFAASLVLAGALITIVGARTTIAIAGAATLAVTGIAALTLARRSAPAVPSASPVPATT
jgi:MFS family permease